MSHGTLGSKAALQRKKAKEVTTPRGEKAYIRIMSGAERDEWMKQYKAEQATAGESPCAAVYCPLLVRTLSDEGGNRLYADDQTAEVAQLESTLLYELFEASLDVNRLGVEAVDDEKKGSGQTQNSNSGLPSPPISE